MRNLGERFRDATVGEERDRRSEVVVASDTGLPFCRVAVVRAA